MDKEGDGPNELNEAFRLFRSSQFQFELPPFISEKIPILPYSPNALFNKLNFEMPTAPPSNPESNSPNQHFLTQEKFSSYSEPSIMDLVKKNILEKEQQINNQQRNSQNNNLISSESMGEKTKNDKIQTPPTMQNNKNEKKIVNNEDINKSSLTQPINNQTPKLNGSADRKE